VRRKKSGEQRAYRSYDFLQDVQPRRLQLIGAITLAWNWIDGAVDATLGVALELHPDMWVQVTSRINGMDGKIALLKVALGLQGYPPLPDGTDPAIRKTLGAIETNKRLRDGIIHARLIHPEEIIADSAHRRGMTDEVLLSEDALSSLYNLLSLLVREVDQLVILYYYRWRLSEESEEEPRQLLAGAFLQARALYLDLQKKREELPPLPEFPDPPQAPPASEVGPLPPV
jgi:hypothetical protein